MAGRNMTERRRRFAVVIIIMLVALGGAVFGGIRSQPALDTTGSDETTITANQTLASEALGTLAVKDRAPRTGYSREQFGHGWDTVGACDVRNHILKRDLTDAVLLSDTDCTVLSGTLHDPYTAKTIQFTRGRDSSGDVQIDHVVALSDAWQKGAQQLSSEQRTVFANDPLNLLAVDGPTNMSKGDGDAAAWLPPDKPYRCRYIARQIAVKVKYVLWITEVEWGAMKRVLQTCPGQVLPIVEE